MPRNNGASPSGELKYIRRKKGRGGKIHLYYEAPGKDRIALRGPIGSPEFLADYQAATLGVPKAPALRYGAGTIAALIRAYRASAYFKEELASSTQAVQTRLMTRIEAKYGDCLVLGLDEALIKSQIESLCKGPSARRNFYKMYSQLMKLAKGLKWRKDNPLLGVERPKSKGTRHCWTDDEIAGYRKRWPIGTRQRLSMEVLLKTGQRVSDAVRFTHQDNFPKKKRFHCVQKKTGIEVDVSLRTDLLAVLDASPTGIKAILLSARGRPYSEKSFPQVFGKWCEQAGLPERCTAHGLRKAFARLMAEAGATAHEIMAAGGWETLAEVERYTKSANRARLGDSGLAKIAEM